MTRNGFGASLAVVLVAWSTTAARAQGPAYTPPPQQPGYVQLDAPLNPVPRPNIPWQVGGTMYTNQAFYAHEMLYPHCYRAMYGPYYWSVTGGWKITPGGVREVQHWRLKGTQVKVNYRSSRAPFSLFIPPSIR